ncbi:hypothetical protein HDU67_002144 [Dinochytrium kinnereticum]|nr:hypothetical protein HDU67_002144 [Dinochytrium kinnereticum]
MRTFEKHAAEIARRKEKIEKAEMLIEGERRRNMSEVRIAQAKAEVGDVKKKYKEETTREVRQLKYDIVEMEEMIADYRERYYNAESNLEARENELEEFKNADGRHLQMLETSQMESAERITQLKKRLELAQAEKSLLVTELENARRGTVAQEDIGDVKESKLVGAAKGQVVHVRDLRKKEHVGELKNTFALSDVIPKDGSLIFRDAMTDDDLAWLIIKFGFPFIILTVPWALYSLFTNEEDSREKLKKD